MKNWFDVPILIPVRDRVNDLIRTLKWLRTNGYHNVTLIENGSTYPALVEWLHSEEVWSYAEAVYWLNDNVGSRSPWLPAFSKLREDWFVVTDPDIVPVEQCPPNLVEHLAGLLEAHPEVRKAGVGLYIRGVDFKERYREQLWQAADRWLGDCFYSPVETTFALYRPGIDFTFDAVRSAFPYVAHHLPWEREGEPTAEDRYYLAHAKASGFDPLGRATGGSDWAGWAGSAARA